MNTSVKYTINETAHRPAITAYHIEQFLKSQQQRVENKAPLTRLLNKIENTEAIAVRAVETEHAERESVESFIKHVFYHHHNASLSAFMPTLMAASDSDDEVYAAVGIRHIDVNAIFLEQYLDQPIDKIIGQLAEKRVERHQIAEVGNLACTSAGASRKLIALLVHYFDAKNVEWAVCTGTSAVRAILKKLGIHFTYIEKANPECLGDEQHKWGNYYHHNPYVLAIDIQQAMDVLGEEFVLENERV